MGLFDDAIREHLDLKRRHGADPAEVDRAEQEALGPVRRRSSAPAEAIFDHQLEAEEDLAYEEEEEGYSEEPFAAKEETFAAEEEPFGIEEELDEEEAARGAHFDYEPQEPHERPRQWAPYDREEDLEGPDAISKPPRRHDRRPRDERSEQETAEYQVPEERRKQGDDVLEQTPEPLEDTPHHDRLWFEERPSRDFDFDK